MMQLCGISATRFGNTGTFRDKSDLAQRLEATCMAEAAINAGKINRLAYAAENSESIQQTLVTAGILDQTGSNVQQIRRALQSFANKEFIDKLNLKDMDTNDLNTTMIKRIQTAAAALA